METQLAATGAKSFKPGVTIVALMALLVFALDQLTKYMVLAHIGMGNRWIPLPVLGDWLRITPGINTGTACGYFPDLGMFFTLAPFFILAAVILFYRSQKKPSWLLSIGVGLIIGGAFGNLTDRLRFGYVVDFIQVGIWPVFNVADAAVSTAVVLILLWSLREDAAQSRVTDLESTRASSLWKLGLAFLGIMAVVAAVGFLVCVYIPANFLR